MEQSDQSPELRLCRLFRDSTVVAAIELDDKSHEAASTRIETDQKKNRATASAGVRLIRWNVRALPDAEMIRQTFSDNRLTAGAGHSRGA